jgi:endonuclease/exonuclease/phosphatase family metal-dependent hydrolase
VRKSCFKQRILSRVQFHALGWNLFHGRDKPPDPALFTWRSRLLRITERDETHVQVNRDLFDEFATVLSKAEWDVALLQETPPRWAEPLARACDAEPHRVLTSRNSLAPLRTLLARLNPDLIASGEGGSNLTLVRHGSPLGSVTERREMQITTAGAPERRAMAMTRTESGLHVANLHATNDHPPRAAEEVLRAAETAVTWAGSNPLLFGGDLNLRPGPNPYAFEQLRERFDLVPPTGPDRIDHLLGRSLEVIEAPAPWAPEGRDVPAEDGLSLRPSDHDPVAAVFETVDAS